MEHPLVDLERNLLCAAILLAWAGILLSISAVSPFTKLACLIGLLCVLVHTNALLRHLDVPFNLASDGVT